MRLGRGYVQANSPSARSQTPSPPRIISSRVPISGILRPDARTVPPKPDGGGEWCRLDLLRIEMEASADQGLTHQGQFDQECDPSYYMNSDEEEEGESDEGG